LVAEIDAPEEEHCWVEKVVAMRMLLREWVRSGR
jgi:hypothetical protein